MCLFAQTLAMTTSTLSTLGASKIHSPIICFRGGQLVSEDGTLTKGDLWVRGGVIIDPLQLFYGEKKKPDKVIDCSGLLVSPGLIDIQINGAFGVDFSSLREDGVTDNVSLVSMGLLRYGVTAYVPTIVTSSKDYYRRVLPLLCPKAGGRHGAAVLGVHCEGPFINIEKKGAHEESFIQSSLSPSLFQQFYGPQLDNLRIVTVAPELEGASDTISWLKNKTNGHEIVVSVGHSMSQLKQAEQAVRSGASLITHLFNAMLPFHHRDPGIVGLLTSLKLEGREVYYGIIADGLHTHETVQRIAYNAHPHGVVLVTDAIAAMGLPDGSHNLGTMSVEVKDGAARLTGKTTLAGSVATMDSCVRHFKQATGCSSGQALVAATLHPARVLGLENKLGTLCIGSKADIVLLDSELNVQATCIEGEIVWCMPGSRFGSPLDN